MSNSSNDTNNPLTEQIAYKLMLALTTLCITASIVSLKPITAHAQTPGCNTSCWSAGDWYCRDHSNAGCQAWIGVLSGAITKSSFLRMGLLRCFALQIVAAEIFMRFTITPTFTFVVIWCDLRLLSTTA